MKKKEKEWLDRWMGFWKKAAEALLNLLYPPRCPICEGLLRPGEGRICPACREGLPYIGEPLCKSCGKPLGCEEQELCGDCRRRPHEFVCGRAVFLYEKSFRRSVQRMKYQNHREYLDFYGEELAAFGERYLRSWGIQTILPVPVNERKRRERGFDQSVLLARKVSALTGIPVEERALFRSRYTLPQKDLDARQRRRNLKSAFTLRDSSRLREPLLLLDDIYTTGSTMDEVCRELKRNGFTRIYFLVLCAGKGK